MVQNKKYQNKKNSPVFSKFTWYVVFAGNRNWIYSVLESYFMVWLRYFRFMPMNGIIMVCYGLLNLIQFSLISLAQLRSANLALSSISFLCITLPQASSYLLLTSSKSPTELGTSLLNQYKNSPQFLNFSTTTISELIKILSASYFRRLRVSCFIFGNWLNSSRISAVSVICFFWRIMLKTLLEMLFSFVLGVGFWGWGWVVVGVVVGVMVGVMVGEVEGWGWDQDWGCCQGWSYGQGWCQGWGFIGEWRVQEK